MTVSKQSFGENLKALRHRHRLSQKQLAAQIGISPSQMSKLENGSRPITPDILTKLANIFESDFDELITDNNFNAEEFDILLNNSSPNYVTSWQRKVEDLNLKHVVSRVQEKLNSLENNAGVNHERLKRFVEVFNKLQSILPYANSFDTSLKVFESISSAVTSILSELEKANNPDSINYIEIDVNTDKLLEAIPLIKVTESTNVLAAKRKEDIENKYKTFTALIKKTEFDAKEALINLQNLEVEGERLSQLLAGRVLNDFYEKRASEERKSAQKWTNFTWIFAISTIITLLATLIISLISESQNKELDLQFLGAKILITATLGLVAKWTSKRANRHLAEEAKYHRLAINMATVNSFIAPLGETEKNAVISAIAIKTFTENEGNETPTDFETANLLEIIKGALVKGEK